MEKKITRKYTFQEAGDEIIELIEKHITNPDYLGVAAAQAHTEGVGVEFIDHERRGDEYIKEIQEFLANYRDTELEIIPLPNGRPQHIDITIWDYGL